MASTLSHLNQSRREQPWPTVRTETTNLAKELPTCPRLLLDLYHLAMSATVELVGRQTSSSIRTAAIEALTHTAFLLSWRKRGQIRRNVERAFGGNIHPFTVRRITLGCFREFWIEMLHWVPKVGRSLPAQEIEIRGIAHLQEALEEGHGAILWESNGFSRRVQAKRVLHAHGFKLCQTHGATHLGVMATDSSSGGRIRRRILRPIYESRERAFVTENLTIPVRSSTASARIFLDRLRKNTILCMAGDGKIARKLYPVTFLGRTSLFAPGAVRLSRLSGAPLLPMFWIPDNSDGPRLEIGPPIRSDIDEPEQAVIDCLQQFAEELEKRIREWPESYRNWHLGG